MKVLVTGASGFVGRAVCHRLQADAGISVVAAVRRSISPPCDADSSAIAMVQVLPDLGGDADWSAALEGVDAVVHAAARVHVMHERSIDPLAEYRQINVHGTLRLARQAADNGVRRLVFISSVKVNGAATAPGALFSPHDVPAPTEPYGISKWEAEQGLWEIAHASGMELVVVRPPLVYGPGVKANFAALMRATQLGWPLPLGAVNNLRSYLALDNLADFIRVCLLHPMAANQTFLVSDGHDLSTRDLVAGIALAAGRPVRLLPVPVWLLRLGAMLVGRRAEAARLCDNLQLDIGKTADLLAWTPPISVAEGLSRAVCAGDTA
jgi:nucleoside-diphosphate-sugar epimerase